MNGPSAGYVDAGPVIAGTLSGLATLRPPVPVLSLYLDLDQIEFGTQPARHSAITSLLDTAHKRIEDHDTSHRGRVSLRADLERATAFFDEFSAKQSRGVAIFAASGAEIFQPYLLPRPTRTRIVIDDSPFISPLVAAADLRDWLIVLVDSRHARIMHGNTDHIEESSASRTTSLASTNEPARATTSATSRKRSTSTSRTSPASSTRSSRSAATSASSSAARPRSCRAWSRRT